MLHLYPEILPITFPFHAPTLRRCHLRSVSMTYSISRLITYPALDMLIFPVIIIGVETWSPAMPDDVRCRRCLRDWRPASTPAEARRLTPAGTCVGRSTPAAPKSPAPLCTAPSHGASVLVIQACMTAPPKRLGQQTSRGGHVVCWPCPGERNPGLRVCDCRGRGGEGEVGVGRGRGKALLLRPSRSSLRVGRLAFRAKTRKWRSRSCLAAADAYRPSSLIN